MMPFPGGLAATANGLLLFSLAAAILYGYMLERPPSWRRTAAKTLSVFLLAFLAFEQGGPLLLVAALLLGALGDAFLAQDGEPAFLGGLASFLLAHLLYVALFATAGEGITFMLAEPWRILFAFAMAAFVALMLFRLWPQLEAKLRLPVAIYAAAILAMGLSALTLPIPVIIAGASLFMISDGLLAAGKFLLPATSPHRQWTGLAVWMLYYAAQLLITPGVLLA
jgi:uncharacterized membrane protein YhhN